MVEQLVKLVHNPKLVYAVMIINEEYGLTRTNKKEQPTYKNLDDVVEDGKRVMKLFTEILKIPENNITALKDATYD